MLPEEFPEAPLDTVANHCLSDTLRYGHTQARPGLRSRQDIENERWGDQLAPMVENTLILTSMP